MLAALATLTGCDQHRIGKLEEGVATEEGVRGQFGQPENIRDEPDGSRTLEYNRNPAGQQTTLGKPATKTPYAQRQQEAWDWRYLQPPNTSMVFTVWFDRDLRVVGTSTGPDPEAPESRGVL